MTFPALALLEFQTIASGIQAGDAMVKRAPVAQMVAGTVHPGRYLVLVTGDVASVEEAVKAGKEIASTYLFDWLFLPNVHPTITAVLRNASLVAQPQPNDALGILETVSVASAIAAADAALKGAEVTLVQLRLADGLGGKGVALFTGLVADVEAAVALGAAQAGGQLIQQAVVSQLHGEMWPHVQGDGRFGSHWQWRAW